MSPNYFVPDFRVEIDGAALDADVSKNITQVTVVSEPNTLDQLDLLVANPYPTMRWTHTDDAQLFQEGSGIRVEMGYIGAMQTLFDGEITGISPTFPQSGTPTVGITAHSRLHRLRGTPNTRTFQNMTDKQIVQEVVRHLTVEAEETGTVHPSVRQHEQSDFDFLLERARRIRFEMLTRGKTLIFRKAAEGSSKVYTLDWGRTLLSFSPTMDTLNQVSGVSVRGYNPGTKEPIVGRAGPGDEDASMGGSRTGGQVAQQAFGGPTEEVRVDRPVATREEADQMARAIYNRRALDFVTGTGSSIGLPELRAGRVVELLGLGPRFSGNYLITRSTHSFGAGGYTTTFAVRRNSI